MATHGHHSPTQPQMTFQRRRRQAKRAQHVPGRELSFAVSAAGMLYFAQTWHLGHRPALVVLNVLAVVAAERDRLTASRAWRRHRAASRR